MKPYVPRKGPTSATGSSESSAPSKVPVPASSLWQLGSVLLCRGEAERAAVGGLEGEEEARASRL